MTPEERAALEREVGAYEAGSATERVAPGARRRYVEVSRELWDDEQSRPGTRPAPSWPLSSGWGGDAA